MAPPSLEWELKKAGNEPAVINKSPANNFKLILVLIYTNMGSCSELNKKLTIKPDPFPFPVKFYIFISNSYSNCIMGIMWINKNAKYYQVGPSNCKLFTQNYCKKMD